jgi:hypothetical protein
MLCVNTHFSSPDCGVQGREKPSRLRASGESVSVSHDHRDDRSHVDDAISNTPSASWHPVGDNHGAHRNDSHAPTGRTGPAHSGRTRGNPCELDRTLGPARRQPAQKRRPRPARRKISFSDRSSSPLFHKMDVQYDSMLQREQRCPIAKRATLIMRRRRRCCRAWLRPSYRPRT